MTALSYPYIHFIASDKVDLSSTFSYTHSSHTFLSFFLVCCQKKYFVKGNKSLKGEPQT